MRFLSRHRVSVLIVAAAVVAVLATVWLNRGTTTYTADLDPENPGGSGAQALARVLDDQGIDVEVVRSADGLAAARTDASTTIVVTSTGNLGRSTTARLVADRGTAQLILVEPGPQLIRQLGSRSFPATSSTPASVSAGCPAYDGLSLKVDRADAYTAPGCFGEPDGSVLAQPQDGLMFFGAADAMTNDQILAGDNAAITLRLLGQRPHLVWYVPSLSDLAGADSVSASSLLPDWLTPALWMVGMASVGLVVWRARRLGPLAREPLPVEVKAIETTRNLGRLYRRSGDRTHAARALRRATRRRLADRLGLPRNPPDEAVTAAVADRTGRSLDQVAVLLEDGPLSSTDWVLTDLAHQLAELDREVSQP